MAEAKDNQHLPVARVREAPRGERRLNLLQPTVASLIGLSRNAPANPPEAIGTELLPLNAALAIGCSSSIRSETAGSDPFSRESGLGARDDADMQHPAQSISPCIG